MNQDQIKGVHWSFWLVGCLGLLWNIGGGINYLMQTNSEFVLTLPETHRAIIEGRPAWATGGFAIGVFGGALGCLSLLLRKAIASYVFMASFVGVGVTMIHTFNVTRSAVVFSPMEIFVMMVLPVLVAAALIGYARQAEKKDWIS